MADENELSGKVGLDTSGFKAGVNELNAQIRSIETGFRASAAVMDDWSSKSDGLKQRTDSLSDKLQLQKQKLSLLNQEYKKTVTEQGANSKAAQSLANQMFSTEKAIQSTENDLKKFTAELKNVDDAEKKINFSNLKDNLSKIGSGAVTGLKAAGTAIAAIGTAAVAAAVGLASMVTKASENADELQKLSDTTGMSAEKLQELRYVGSAVGVDLDTMVGAQSKLIKSMSAAQSGTKAQADAFRELGISVTDSNGNLRDSNTVFQEAITKLGQMKNPTEQSAMAMKIFGKSAMELNPLIRAGGDQLAALAEEAQKSGAIMSNETVAQLDAFGDSIDALKLSAKGMAGTFSAMLLPALSGLTGLLGNLSVALNSALKTGDFSQFGQVLSDGIASAVEQLSGMTVKFVPIVTQVLTGLVGALVSAVPQLLPALSNGVVQLIQAVAGILQTNGPALVSAGTQAVLALVQGLITALPDIISAALQMILAFADALSQQLPTLIPVAVSAVITLAYGLIDNLPQLVQAAIKIVLALIQGIVTALPQLVTEIPKIIMAIIQALIAALPMLIEAAPKIIVSIITGIIQALPLLIADVPQIIMAIITGLIQAIPQLLSLGPKILNGVWDGLKSQNWGNIGSNIIKGIVSGFSSAWSYVKQGVKNIANSIVGEFKSFFGIHSPSTLMDEEISGNLVAGLAGGLTKRIRQVQQASRELSSAIQISTDKGSELATSISVNGRASVSGGYGTAVTNLYMDSKVIASSTSRVQYSRNSTRARSLGVIPA